MNKVIYCTRCQADKEHTVTVAHGDFVFTCSCGHFAKFPVEDEAALKERIEGHKASNQGLTYIHTDADYVEANGMTKAETAAAHGILKNL